MILNEKKINQMSEVLKIASDPTRLKIMCALLDDGKCHCGCNAIGDCSKCSCLSCMIEKKVSDIVGKLNLSQSLISHQLKTLKDADFVKDRKEGTSVYYSLKDGHIKELIAVVKEHIEEKEHD